MIWIILIAVLAFVAKLIYDVQQNKKKQPTNEYQFDTDKYQKLAGIKPIDTNDEIRQILVKNNFNTEQIKEELKKEFQNSEFPAPDPSIPVTTAKLTTIDLNFKGENDPLASVPMSRVSKEAKQKMAEIAKQDISDRLEAQTEMVKEIIAAPSNWPSEIKEAMVNAKPKKKANPKQSSKGNNSAEPFVKTRKKTTKKKKENE